MCPVVKGPGICLRWFSALGQSVWLDWMLDVKGKSVIKRKESRDGKTG